jgi:hypothetical protein
MSSRTVPPVGGRAAIEALLDTLRSVKQTAKRAGLRLARQSDRRRWTSPGGLEAWWEQRTQRIGELLPAGSRIIEFGAGRRRLESYLPAGCSYAPSDLVDRGPGTLVIDLNARPLPDLTEHRFDVAVFAGVLEYILDVRSLVAWLAAQGIRTCVLSFDAAPAASTWRDGLRERMRRVHFGYMNELTEQELRRCFREAGMACVRTSSWTTQKLFVFEKDA